MPKTTLQARLALFLFALLLLGCENTEHKDSDAVLTTARAVSSHAGADAHPALLKGTVTYHDPSWGVLFLQDSTGGVYVDVAGESYDAQPGQSASISGTFNAEMRGLTNVQLVETGVGDGFPAPIRIHLGEVAAHAGTWIETEGVVEDARLVDGVFTLFINEGNAKSLVRLRRYDIRDNLTLVHRRIRVSGVAAENTRDPQTLRDFQILVPSDSLVTVLDGPVSEDLIQNDLPLLTTVGAIRHLAPDEAALRYPVQVRGVVTYYDSAWRLLFMQDATGGIFVHASELEEAFSLGQSIEVTGWSGPGEFAPQIDQPTVEVLGSAPLPANPVRSLDRMFTGQEDSRWAEIEGVVRDVRFDEFGHVEMEVASGYRQFAVQMPAVVDRVLPSDLVDARVRIRGVCGTEFNHLGQLTGVILFVQNLESITVLKRGPADPFDRPVQRIDHLLRFMPGGDVEHRSRVRGIATLRRDSGHIFVQDGSSGIYVQATEFPDSLKAGHLVDVAGFVSPGGYTPSLTHASVTVTGSADMPKAATVTASQALTGAFDAQRVEMVATLVDVKPENNDYVLKLQSGALLFEAYLPIAASEPEFVSSLQPESLVRVTGVFSAQIEASISSVSFSSFRILVGSSEDVALIKAPSYWTSSRMAYVLSGLLILMLSALGWVTMLRRRVREQTAIIQEKLAEEADLKMSAEAASRAKSEFLANMSHEIRTPMNGIVGMTEILRESGLSPDQSQFVDIIKSSASSLMTIINDILDVSKVEAGKLVLESMEFDLYELMSDTLRSLAVRAHEKDLELACRIRPEVPRRVVGDPVRLRQVLVNLVGNAVKFTDSGEVVVEVAPIVGAPNTDVEFSVSDTGSGIPSDKIDKIFDAFEQGNTSTTRTYGGTGLGLVISRRLVDLMGGRIDVESEPGRGSTFRFRARFDLEDGAPFSPDTSHLQGRQVLIVDDNSTSRRILEEIVLRWGMEPIAAPGGRAALRLLEARGPVPLILLDGDMPGVDGFEVAAHVRETWPERDVTIILFNSTVQVDPERRSRAAGVSTCLMKPFVETDLYEVVRFGHDDPGLGVCQCHPVRPTQKIDLTNTGRREPEEGALRVLLVEDNEVNQHVGVHILEQMGYHVDVAANGRRAIDACADETYDLIIMDVHMPEMNGLEATRRIREIEADTKRRTPIVAMTARAQDEDREACAAAGMDGYVSKPFLRVDLEREIRNVMGEAGDVSTAARDATVHGDGARVPLPAVSEREKISFDPARLRNMLGSDQAKIQEVVEQFVADYPDQLAALEAALHEGNMARAEYLAHTLKGTAANLGFPRICLASGAIEDAVREGRAAGFQAQIGILHEESAVLTAGIITSS